MALPPLATADALSTWLGVDAFTDTDATRADAVMNNASTAVRVEAGRNWVDGAGENLVDVPLGIAELVVRVAARAWPNPTGNKSQTTGPFSATFGDIELTAAEKAVIARILTPPGSQPSGLWVLKTTRGDFNTGTIYLPTSDGGTIPYLDDRDVI